MASVQHCDISKLWMANFSQKTGQSVVKNFQCFLCSETFSSADGLADHIESHDIQKAFQCGFCNERFHENTALLSHISSTHGGLPVLYNCNICKIAFQVLLSLEEHMGRCQGDVAFSTCSHSQSAVGKTQGDPESYGEDIKDRNIIVNADKPKENITSVSFSEICDEIFIKGTNDESQSEPRDDNGNPGNETFTPGLSEPRQGDGKKAFCSHEADVDEKGRKPGDLGNLYKCKICSHSCQSLETFTSHMSEHDLEELYGIWCVKCGKLFDNADSLEKHLTYTECNGFQCQVCQKSFGLETSLVKHTILVHKQSSNVEMECRECGKRFSTHYAWARHEATHAKSLPYVCKICGKHFSSLKHVQGYHLPTAHKLCDRKRNHRPETVDTDNVVDSVPETETKRLKYHRKNTLTKKPSALKRQTRKSSSLFHIAKAPKKTRHRRRDNKLSIDKGKSKNSDLSLSYNKTTSGDKGTFDCKICSQSCESQDKLIEHMSLHALEECYSIRCMKCNTCFDDAESLEKHLEDTDCQGFKCIECNQSFGLEALLLKHKVLVHRQGTGMECSDCGKKCPTHYAWARHEATHAKSQPYMCKICGKHLSSLEHVLRYHLPTAHKLGKSHKVKKKSHFSSFEASLSASTEEAEGNCRQTRSACHKKRRVSTKPITSLTPKKTKVKDSIPATESDVQNKEEPVEKKWVTVDCDICGGKVADHQALANHRAYHFMAGKFQIKCSGCSETFDDMDDLTLHVQQRQCTHYKCDLCLQIFSTEVDFVTHRSQIHCIPQKSGLYNCSECGLSFESHAAYVDHAAEHVSSQPFQCKICSANFSSMALLEVHLNEIHTLIKDDQESNCYKCAQCLETFKTKVAIRVHRRFHMQREVLSENKEDCSKPDSSFASYMTSHFCKICSVGFGGAVHLERHEQMHSVVADKPKCPICGQIFQRNCYLKVHLGHHNRPFLCTACGKTFSSSQTLKHHSLAYHSAVNPFQCQLCHKFYSSKGALRHHLKGHSGEKRFECKLCGKKFSDSTCLESHILIHSVEKRFKCKVCSYECRHRSVLARHMDMHNGVKRYKCSFCGMRFRQHSGLKAHLTIHTGEKNYECEYCGKRFARKDYLNVHTLTHTKEKPLSCPICSDSFAVTSNLNVHVRKVHGEKAYKLFQEQKARNRGLSSAPFNHPSVPGQEMVAAVTPIVPVAPAPLPPPPPPPAPPAPPHHIPQVNSMICPPHLYPPPVYDTDNSSGHPVYHQPQQMFYW